MCARDAPLAAGLSGAGGVGGAGGGALDGGICNASGCDSQAKLVF